MVVAVTKTEFDVLANDRASTKLDKISKSMGKLGEGAKKAGKAGLIGLAVLGTAAISVGPKIVGAAANLELLEKKSQRVFGDQLGSVKKWAGENASAMGLTERSATGLAAGFADLLIPMGFTRKEAAKMATDTVGLSGALSEWSGGTRSAAEVSEILSKAMLGERDSLKELGISILDADVQQRLLEKGQKSLTGTALEQAKAIATQELIFEKSADAQAAYAEGSGTLARKISETKAKVREYGDELLVKATPALTSLADTTVKHVLPALGKMVDIAVMAADVFGEIPAEVKIGTLAFGAFALAAGGTALVVGKTVTAVKALNTAFLALGRTGKALTLSLGGVGLVLAAAAVVYSIFAKRNVDAKQKADDLRSTLDEQTGAVTGNTRAYVANELVMSGLAQKAKGLGLDLTKVTDAATGNKGAFDSLVATLDDMIEAGKTNGPITTQAALDLALQGQAAHELKGELVGMNSTLTDAQKKQKLVGEAAGTHVTAQDKLKAAVEKANVAVQDQEQKVEDVIDALHRYANKLLAVRGGEVAYEAAVDDASAAIKENGRTLDINSAKGRANRTALDTLASTANALTDDMLKNGESHRTVAAKAEGARAKFVTLAMQMGLTKADAERLARGLISIPKKTEADLKADITDLDSKVKSAKAKLKDKSLTATKRAQLEANIKQLLEQKRKAQAAIDALRGKTVNVNVKTIFSTSGRRPTGPGDFEGGSRRREHGGPVQAGRAYIVGEKRAEVFVPDRDGTILPSIDEVNRRGHGSRMGSGGIQIHLHGTEQQLMNQLTRKLDDLRRTGRL